MARGARPPRQEPPMPEQQAREPITAPVFSQARAEVGTIELPAAVFTEPLRRALLADVVRMQTARRRAGTASTKEKGEVSGGGKKPWKQKGTGKARAGSIRSPIWRHGGVTFGPRANQNWTLKINKKAKTAALFMSLSDKAREKQFIVVDQISLDQPKTKDMVKMLTGLK